MNAEQLKQLLSDKRQKRFEITRERSNKMNDANSVIEKEYRPTHEPEI